jgi:hypothetical protein
MGQPSGIANSFDTTRLRSALLADGRHFVLSTSERPKVERASAFSGLRSLCL